EDGEFARQANWRRLRVDRAGTLKTTTDKRSAARRRRWDERDRIERAPEQKVRYSHRFRTAFSSVDQREKSDASVRQIDET
ncbi:hypothetical protein ACFVHA_28895, partial [Bacillus cereus]|uniref:hypothetical protein n=1 Tax=Bacillus cereus TaxID=1396 RepID=UPI00363D282B